jgi:hypothetical protein
MSLPVESDPAGMLIVALPLLRVVAVEVYPPPLSVTKPVGVGVPLTATVTVNGCAVVMLDELGVTVIVGVVFARVTVTAEEVPVALL